MKEEQGVQDVMLGTSWVVARLSRRLQRIVAWLDERWASDWVDGTRKSV